MSGGGHSSSPLPFFDAVTGIFHSAHEGGGIHIQIKPIIITAIASFFGFLILAPQQSFLNISFVIFLAPIWLPIVLGYFAVGRWIEANRLAWLANQEYVLLELRMPRDVRKTPLAMETVLSSLYLAPGESSWWKKYVNGSARPWWSLEIVSLGGRVHFYIWTRDGYRRGLESYIYAQYPEIEIVEATDYSLLFDPSHKPNEMWGCEYALTKSSAFPIKTYTEFINPTAPLAKPEETIDPLAQLIEFLGSIGPKEQFWIQILIRTNKGDEYNGKKKPDGGAYTLRDEANEEVSKIRQSTQQKTTYVDPATGQLREATNFPNPTKGQQEGMYAIERKVNKQLFDVGIRAIYSAPGDAYQGVMVPHQIVLLKPFSNEAGNGFKLAGRWDAVFNDWPWEDPGGKHRAHLDHQLVDAYRRRSYFYEPYKLPWFVLNVEELATLFHIPSSSVTTPSLPRIQSTTGSSPSNLPT